MHTMVLLRRVFLTSVFQNPEVVKSKMHIYGSSL